MAEGKRYLLVNPEDFYMAKRHTNEKNGYCDRIDFGFRQKDIRRTIAGMLEAKVKEFIEKKEHSYDEYPDLSNVFEFRMYGVPNETVVQQLEKIFRISDITDEAIFVEYY